MSTIANIYTGNSINETEKQRKYVGLFDGYNYIATKDVSFEHVINYENGVKIPFNEINFKVAYKDTPLLCIEGGSAGRITAQRPFSFNLYIITDINKSAVSLLAKSDGKWFLTSFFSLPP